MSKNCNKASVKTQEKYDRIVANLFSKFTGKDLTDKSNTKKYKKDLAEFTKTKKFISFMENEYKKISTRHSYINIVKCALVQNTRYIKAIDTLQKYFDELDNEKEDRLKSQKVFSDENKKTPDLKMIQKKTKDYKDDLVGKAMIGVYVFFPSRRNTDFRLMKHSKNLQQAKSDTKSNHVFFVDDKGYFVFQNFKTVKKYGAQIFEIKNPFLKSLLKEYLSNIEFGDYIFANRRNLFFSPGGFSNLFKDKALEILGKPYLINDMRRAWINSKMKLNTNEKQKELLGEMMGTHSFLNYNKIEKPDSMVEDEIF